VTAAKGVNQPPASRLAELPRPSPGTHNSLLLPAWGQLLLLLLHLGVVLLLRAA
jgi:hypothetical protein